MTDSTLQVKSHYSRFELEEIAVSGGGAKLSLNDCQRHIADQSTWPTETGTAQTILVSHAASAHVRAPLHRVWTALTDINSWKAIFGYEEIRSYQGEVAPGSGFGGRRRTARGSALDRVEFQSVKEGIVIQYFLWSSDFDTAAPHLVTLTLRDSWENTRISALEAWPSSKEGERSLVSLNPWDERLARVKALVEGE